MSLGNSDEIKKKIEHDLRSCSYGGWKGYYWEKFKKEIMPKIIDGSYVEFFEDKHLVTLTKPIKMRVNNQSDFSYSGADISVLKIFVEKKRNIPQECLYNLMNPFHFNNPEIYNILNLLLLSGCKLDNLCMSFACEYFCKDAIKYLLEKNIMPNKKNVKEIFDHKPEKYAMVYIKKNLKTKSEIISMFIVNKYNFDHDEIMQIFEERLNVNLKSLDVEINSEFFNKCKEHNVYPDFGKKTDGMYDISCLEEACKYTDFNAISDLVKKYKNKPNLKCLEEACKNHDNENIINFLINEGKLTPTYDCIKNYLKANKDEASLFMLDLYLKKN